MGSLTLASALVGLGTTASSATIREPVRAGTLHPVGTRSPLSALHPHVLLPPQNPTSNSVPTSAMYENCLTKSPTSSQVTNCDQETVSAIDAARTGEDVGSMTLPVGYDQMPQTEQVLVVSNLERTDRGLTPVAGLSSSLDALALTGAQNNTDPPFPNPFYGTGGGSNWASTSSVLLADFLFMYDDGPGVGGINSDCTASNASDCWGHRDNILGNYDQPLLMGAATVSGFSLTEEFIGGDRVDEPDVTTWSSLATLFPVAVSVSPGIPGTPTDVIARSAASRVRVTWNAPSWDGGDAIVAYRVYSTPAGLHCTTSATACVMTNALSHGSYLFTVVAQNAIGLSVPSTRSNRVTFTK